MAKENPVYQVLITSGNQHPMAKGSRVTALKNGQIGVFNVHTGMSVDSTSPASDLKNIYIAVGINRTLGGVNTAEDIASSAGQFIQAKNVDGYTFKGYNAGVSQKIVVSAFTVAIDDECTLKIELRNQAAYREFGFNQFAKSFTVVATTAVAADLATAMVTQVNLDPDGLITAAVINTDQIELTINPYTLANNVNDINIKYLGLDGTFAVVTTPSGDPANGFSSATITQTQALKFKEGGAQMLRQAEYEAGGWNGKPGPYRQSSLTGLARNGFEYFTDMSKTYQQIVVNGIFQTSDAFNGQYEHYIETIIAIPVGDSNTLLGDAGTTSYGITGILDAAFTQFSPLANDAAANDTEQVAASTLAVDAAGIDLLS